jgi:hypothetical protein
VDPEGSSIEPEPTFYPGLVNERFQRWPISATRQNLPDRICRWRRH